jgi:hypothetical protein
VQHSKAAIKSGAHKLRDILRCSIRRFGKRRKKALCLRVAQQWKADHPPPLLEQMSFIILKRRRGWYCAGKRASRLKVHSLANVGAAFYYLPKQQQQQQNNHILTCIHSFIPIEDATGAN